MPTAQRARTIAAAPELVWQTVSDPHHLPRWWPDVERVEGVDGERFTEVLRTRRGRPVRADFTVARQRAPELLEWRQELAGSPFARVLAQSLITLELTSADGTATTLTISHDQRLRGSSRTGGFMLRRATTRRLEAALAGLAAVVEDPARPTDP